MVIYHANCQDGFCSAWLLWREFPDAQFIPANYGDAPPDVSGKIVYVVDFSFPRDVMIRLNEEAALLVVLDHHKTAQANLAGLPFCIFNMEKSGARLTWEYIQSSIKGNYITEMGKQPPWLVSYTEDRDLWNWDLPESKEVNACLASHPMDFELWNSFDNEDSLARFVSDGEAILRYQESVVRSICANKRMVEVIKGDYEDHWMVCNSNMLMSEVGNELAKTTGIGCCWFEKPDGSRLYSLRAIKDSSADCSKIAKRFGGGGHPGAAGFTLSGKHPWET
jgi:hypothetical protein